MGWRKMFTEIYWVSRIHIYSVVVYTHKINFGLHRETIMTLLPSGHQLLFSNQAGFRTCCLELSRECYFYCLFFKNLIIIIMGRRVLEIYCYYLCLIVTDPNKSILLLPAFPLATGISGEGGTTCACLNPHGCKPIYASTCIFVNLHDYQPSFVST